MKLRSKRRGQVAVFYALLIPLFLFCGGVGLDLGWYYLNVSRLQNAADAAVLVGAKTLINEHPHFKDKLYFSKLVFNYPKDNMVLKETIDTKVGDEVATEYAIKNLSSDKEWQEGSLQVFSTAEAAQYKFNDNYTRGDPTIKLTTGLYQYTYDDGSVDYFYTVHMTENIHHFFIGFLDDMEAPVIAVARISPKIKVNFDPKENEGDRGSFGDDSRNIESKEYVYPAHLIPGNKAGLLEPDKGKPIYVDSEGNPKLFAGWNPYMPKERDNIENYESFTVKPGTVLDKETLKKLEPFINDNGEITLYAVYIRNSKTLWEQMQYLVAKYVYNDYWYAAKAKYGGDPINVSICYANTYKETQNVKRKLLTTRINTISARKPEPVNRLESKTIFISTLYAQTARTAATNLKTQER